MKELEGAVDSKKELDRIKEEVILALSLKYNENLYVSAKTKNNFINDLGKDLSFLFKDRLEEIKKAV